MSAAERLLTQHSPILFDYDDTIVAAKDHRRQALQLTMRLFGVRLSRASFNGTYGQSFRELVAALAPGLPFDAFLNEYASHVRDHPAELLPGVRAYLDAIRARRIPAGVVSSSDSRLIRVELLAHGLVDRFAIIHGSESDRPAKPDPQSLLVAADELGLTSNLRPAYVGDSLIDWQMAQQAEFSFLAVTTGAVTAEQFQAANVPLDSIVPSLSLSLPCLPAPLSPS